MKKVLIVVFLHITCFASVDAQSVASKNLPRNVISIEVGGPGGVGSLNYEHLFFSKNRVNISSRIGFSTYHLNDYTTEFNPDLIFPIAISGWYGNDHNLEVGFGQTISSIVYADDQDYQPTRENRLHSFFSIGYRYQKKTSRFMFRIAYTPIIELNKIYRHWVGSSFGYVF